MGRLRVGALRRGLTGLGNAWRMPPRGEGKETRIDAAAEAMARGGSSSSVERATFEGDEDDGSAQVAKRSPPAYSKTHTKHTSNWKRVRVGGR